MDRPYQFYYFVPLVTVWFMVIYVTLALWPQITQKKANGNFFWYLGLLLKLGLLLLCIWFLAYSQTYSIWASSCKNKAECNELHPSVSVVQLFICQYHIWLAADTRGILVLIPGNPTLNIIVSTFIFVCVAHEISQITTDLAQVVIPKDNPSLFRRLACTIAFFGGVLILSSIQDKSRL